MKIHKNYILFPAVIVIWAIIGYRFYLVIDGGDDATPSYVNKSEPAHDAPDTSAFKLVANYRDPFLSESVQTPLQSAGSQYPRRQSDAPKSPTHISKTIDWPELIYQGMIENNQSKKRIALISFKGKSMMLKEGENISDLKISAISKDSLQLSGYGSIKVYKKNR